MARRKQAATLMVDLGGIEYEDLHPSTLLDLERELVDAIAHPDPLLPAAEREERAESWRAELQKVVDARKARAR